MKVTYAQLILEGRKALMEGDENMAVELFVSAAPLKALENQRKYAFKNEKQIKKVIANIIGGDGGDGGDGEEPEALDNYFGEESEDLRPPIEKLLDTLTSLLNKTRRENEENIPSIINKIQATDLKTIDGAENLRLKVYEFPSGKLQVETISSGGGPDGPDPGDISSMLGAI